MADVPKDSNLANSVDALARTVQELRDQLKSWTPAAAVAPPQEALQAARRFRDVRRGLQLKQPLALAAEAASASEVKLAWTVDEPELTPTRLLRCEGENCTAFTEIRSLKPEERSHTDGGLSGNKTYRYKLTAPASAGNEWFVIAEAKTKS